VYPPRRHQHPAPQLSHRYCLVSQPAVAAACSMSQPSVAASCRRVQTARARGYELGVERSRSR
jgi:hypothetical protein